MRKWNWRRWKASLPQLRLDEADDRFLLVNLYATQGLTLLLAVVLLLFQRHNPLPAPGSALLPMIWLTGLGFAAAVLAVDLLVGKFVPEEAADDGGINELLFGGRAYWHIVLLSAIVSFCEELLFRGAIQHALGAYWTSILFAAIHVRYLRHWLMTGLVFSISYGLGWIYLRTGTLLTPIIAHFAIDFVMGCIIKYRRNHDEDRSPEDRG